MKTTTRSIVAAILLSVSSLAFAETKTEPKKVTTKTEAKTEVKPTTKESHLTGTLISQDAAKNEVTVAVKQKGKSEDLLFNVPADAKIELAGKTSSLSDLQKGETIKLSYTVAGSARNVTALKATPLPVKKEPVAKKETPKK